MSNIIFAAFENGATSCRTSPLYQYDYGQILRITGIELPTAYETHFSNEPHGTAVIQIGSEDGVTIPDSLLLSGRPVYAWIFLHTGADDGETEYVITIPVIGRATITDDPPTPVEQRAIDQAIAALDLAVEKTGEDVETAAGFAESARQYAQDAETAREGAAEARNDAEDAKDNAILAKEAAEAARTAAETARDTARTAQRAASESADFAESYAESADIAWNGAERAKNRAEAALAEFTNVTAVAETLPPGSQATANYQNGTLTFGIPRGVKGETGDTGPQGEKGETGPAGPQGIQGPKGETGDRGATGPQGVQGEAGPKGESGVYYGTTAPIDPDINVWIDPNGTSDPDIEELKDDVEELKSAIGDIDPILFDTEESRNIFTPTAIRLYPDTGSYAINSDGTITFTGLAKGESVWITPQADFELTAGDYVLCMDDGLFVYGSTVFAIQSDSGGSYHSIITADTNKYEFTYNGDDTGNKRIAIFFNSAYPYDSINWSGHIWLVKGEYQDYMPVGGETKTAKEFVNEDQGIENAGKLLGIDDQGTVVPVENKADTAVQKTLYQRGNLLDYDEISNGYIKANGEVQPYNSLWCSGFVPIQAGNLYCNVVGGSIIPSQYFAFYDSNKELVASYSTVGAMQRITPSVYSVTVPTGSTYFRCTFAENQNTIRKAWCSNNFEKPYPETSYNVDNVYPYTLNPENPCDYSELTVKAFSKVVCIGDSLTYGGFNMSDSGTATGQTQSPADLALRYSYPTNFQRITGIETVNEGDSGETTVSWYSNHSSHDFTSYDLAIIHLGVNDSAFGVSDADTLTAMQNIVTMLNNARSDMRIAICSVIPAYDGAGYQAKGQLILNWAKSLNNPNIIPLDLAAYSHVRPQTSYVAGHCSALGYYMMALDIARYISWYMDHHKRDFRFIQFIGSPDAEWSGD